MPNKTIRPHQVEAALFKEQKEEKWLNQPAWEIAPPPDPQENPYQDDDGPRYKLTPILHQVLPCPICHITGRHTSRIYETYEINTCEINPDNIHSWRVDYQTVGQEIYQAMREELQLAVGLVNEIQTIFTTFGFSWGKSVKPRDRNQIERVKRFLSHLREILDNSRGALPRGYAAYAVAQQVGIVQATDFKQVIEGRFYIGARLFRSESDAARAVEQVINKYFIRPRIGLIPASEVHPTERYVVALPRDPRNTLEATFTTIARAFLTSLSQEEFPEPEMPLVSLILPAPQEEPELPPARPGSKPKSRPEEYIRGGFQGLVFAADHDDALRKARVLRQDFGLPVRAIQINPSLDYPQERHLIMVSKDADAETRELMKYWLDNLREDYEPYGAGGPDQELPGARSEPEHFLFKSAGKMFRGLAFAPSHAEARRTAMILKKEFGVFVRCRDFPAKDGQPDHHVVMIPDEIDPETIHILKLWLEAMPSHQFHPIPA